MGADAVQRVGNGQRGLLHGRVHGVAAHKLGPCGKRPLQRLFFVFAHFGAGIDGKARAAKNPVFDVAGAQDAAQAHHGVVGVGFVIEGRGANLAIAPRLQLGPTQAQQRAAG